LRKNKECEEGNVNNKKGEGDARIRTGMGWAKAANGKKCKGGTAPKQGNSNTLGKK